MAPTATTEIPPQSNTAGRQKLPCGRFPTLPLRCLRLPAYSELPAELRPPSQYEPNVSRDDMINVPAFEKLPCALKKLAYPLPPRLWNGFAVSADQIVRIMQEEQMARKGECTDSDEIREWPVKYIQYKLSHMVGCPVEVKPVLNAPSEYVLSLRSNDYFPGEFPSVAPEHVAKLRDILGLPDNEPMLWYICREKWHWGRSPGAMM